MNRILHENQSNHSRIGGTPQGGGEAIATEPWGKAGSTDRWGCGILSLPLGEDVEDRRIEGATSETQPRRKPTAESQAEAAVAANPPPRASPLRLQDGYVDVSTRCQSDRAEIRCEISFRSCLASVVGIGMELSEAGATGSGTKGTSHSAMAQEGLASHKKGARDDKLASFFSMKQAICFSRFVGARGLRGARRPSSVSGIGTIVSRPSARLPSLRPDAGYDCTSKFSVAMSVRRTWSRFCGSCTVGWDGPLSWSGIARDPIERPPELCWPIPNGSRSRNFRPMPRNSIRAKSAGTIRSIPTWQTSSPMTLITSKTPSSLRYASYAGTRPCYVPSSPTPASSYKEFHCQYRTQ